ncbi:MAG: 23S rRNA (adenine(2503)-C(2))-methyltransferase RlmN, partial [Inquilinaceae bacterium]
MSIGSHAALFAPPPRADGRRNLVGLTREELAAELEALGESPFRLTQLWSWIYRRGVTDFGMMGNLGKPLRAKLEERFVVGRPAVSRRQDSIDGTRKWLLRLDDGQEVEAVHIPEEDRGALCVSS